VDPFDISDPSDIEALTAPPPKTKQKVQPPPPLPKKSILKKPTKRKVEELEEEPREPARKKKSLSKGVLDKLAQDNAEIEYLEKKLKIKNKKTPKGFEDDGLDFLLDGLKDNYFDDRAERAREINAKQRNMDFGSEEENVDDDEDGDYDERDQLDDISDIDSGDEEGENQEDGEEDDGENAEDMEEEEEEFTGFSDAEPSEVAPIPTVRENPYKAPVAATQSAGKYIPPSLRKPATTESEQHVRLRRQMQGLINRLSEAKLVPLLGDVENLYRTNPRGDVTDLITDILVSTLCDPSALQDTYHILHGGFLAGLYKIMGVDVGANVVQRVVEEFLKHHGKVNGIANPSTAGKECTNLISFLSELYNLQVVSCVLIFDLIRLFLFELTELHTELLLKVVRSKSEPS
jgi:nucleolar MIF4G domain-containing protein 1